MIMLMPGEYFISDKPVTANAGRKTTKVKVSNTGNRPVQVGSHTHFFEVNKVLEDAANGPLKGVLNYVTEELVSVDFNHTYWSSSVDSKLTNVIAGRMVKVFSWYDNEYGYSSRVSELAQMMGELLD